ncbi:MAG: class I mannose-6-phosphate isomerase [Planctomycetaceae bacterium]
MPPLKFHPIFKRIRWGGRRLETLLGKPLPEGDDYAESWEISCHPHGESVVDGGPYDGRTLKELIVESPQNILGQHASLGKFPLLVKFLDAHDRLSVQVHPNDTQASQYRTGESGKTEAWVILAAEPDSQIYAGLKSDVTAEQFQEAIQTDNVESCLHSVTAFPGDCFFIPAGTVHAIGEGILLAEIQQSSDLTFRLYDWGRVDASGQPRELHIQEAMECIDFSRGPVNPVIPHQEHIDETIHEQLVECEHFIIRRHTSRTPFTVPTDNRFHIFIVLDGQCEIADHHTPTTAPVGQSLLIPASCPDVKVTPSQEKPLVLLDAFLP